MSGGPPSDPQDDTVFAGPPFLLCFLSFRPFLESTVWLLTHQNDTLEYRKVFIGEKVARIF